MSHNQSYTKHILKMSCFSESSHPVVTYLQMDKMAREFDIDEALYDTPEQLDKVMRRVISYPRI